MYPKRKSDGNNIRIERNNQQPDVVYENIQNNVGTDQNECINCNDNSGRQKFSENPPNFATSSEEEIVASVMSNVGSVIKCHLPASMEITAVEEAIVGFLMTNPLTLLLVGLVNGGKVAAIDSVTSTMEVPLSILNFLPK